MTSGRPGVLLDVDGTLIDSNYLHALAWSRAIVDAGEWAPMNALHRLVGMGGDQLVTEVLGHDSETARKARSGYYQQLYGDLRPFPRAAQLLRKLAARNLAVVLATSAPQDELDVLLGILDAGSAITGYTTSDDVTSSKPDPEIFTTAMTRYGLDPTRTLAIGDSVWDIEAARAAGIGLLAVESGGFSQHELSEAGALHVYRDVAEIVDLLNVSPIAFLHRA